MNTASCTDMGSKEQEGCAANTLQMQQDTTCEQNKGKGKDQQDLHAQSNIHTLSTNIYKRESACYCMHEAKFRHIFKRQ